VFGDVSAQLDGALDLAVQVLGEGDLVAAQPAGAEPVDGQDVPEQEAGCGVVADLVDQGLLAGEVSQRLVALSVGVVGQEEGVAPVELGADVQR